MGTYSLEGLADFILQLFDQESEDEIWQTWLHKDYKENYDAFKKKYLKRMHKSKTRAISKQEEQTVLANAIKFIKPITKGGESEI